MRAVNHWFKMGKGNVGNMAVCDFTKRGLSENESPSYWFRRQARKFEVIRCFVFLAQMVLKFVRVWRPTREQIKHYGMGVYTPGRIALLMMHTAELPQDAVTQLTSLKRHLFNRVSHETGRLKALTQVVKEEQSDDMMAVTSGIRDQINRVVFPALREGRLPKFNVDHDALTQYEDCWQVFLTREFQVWVCVMHQWIS